MSKKVAVLVEQQFHDTELWISYYRMSVLISVGILKDVEANVILLNKR